MLLGGICKLAVSRTRSTKAHRGQLLLAAVTAALLARLEPTAYRQRGGLKTWT